VKQRTIPEESIVKWEEKIENMKEDIEFIMKEEQTEKQVLFLEIIHN
jgi:hypothetical protein